MKSFILTLFITLSSTSFAAEQAAKELHGNHQKGHHKSYHNDKEKQRSVSSTYSREGSLEREWKSKEGAICYHPESKEDPTCIKI